MKAEQTDKPPVVDLRTPDGIRAQSDSSKVIAVLLSDGSGNWIEIVPGSFHFWMTAPEAGRSVPYVQFTTTDGHNVECFPSSCAAFRYIK